MIIVCKNHLNTIATEFQKIILEDGVSIKTTRIKELLAQSQGYKTSNGLIHDLPIIFKNNSAVQQIITDTFLSRHQVNNANIKQCLDRLKLNTRAEIQYSPLASSGYKVGYESINNAEKPFLKKGEGSLLEGIAFLTILFSNRIIYPHIETKLENIDSLIGDELNLSTRIQIPTNMSFKKIHEFINDSITLSYLIRLNKGFTCTNIPTKQIGKLKYLEGKLTKDAKNAVQDLKTHTLKALGNPAKPVINI